MLALEEYRSFTDTKNAGTTSAWYKSERYDYCEPYFEKKSKSHFHSFLVMVLTLIIR